MRMYFPLGFLTDSNDTFLRPASMPQLFVCRQPFGFFRQKIPMKNSII